MLIIHQVRVIQCGEFKQVDGYFRWPVSSEQHFGNLKGHHLNIPFSVW